MAKNFKEIGKKAEMLIEQGKEVDQRIQNCQARVASLNNGLIAARWMLAAASEIDENGDSVGDVEYARAQLSMAENLLEASQRDLSFAERELEQVNKQKEAHIQEIDRHNKIEQFNLEKLRKLRSCVFSDNSNMLTEEMAQRLNEAEDARVALLRSMGIDANPDYVAVDIKNSSEFGWKGGGFAALDTAGQEQNYCGGLERFDNYGGIATPIGGALASIGIGENRILWDDSEKYEGTIQTQDNMVLTRKIPDNERYKNGLAYIEQILEISRDNLRDRGIDDGLEMEKEIAAIRANYLKVLSVDIQNGEYTLEFLPTPDFDAIADRIQKNVQSEKWNTEYMPLVKDNIRQSVKAFFSKYVSEEKLERCLEALSFMNQEELHYRYEAGGGHMPEKVLGYNNGQSSNIASDMKDTIPGDCVGKIEIQGSGNCKINYAFVTAVHENLHMMSANDLHGEIRRGILVGLDEKSRAMNEAFTEYFTFISCGGKNPLGGLYPGAYSGYHELMKEMPIIESAIGIDCMMDAYFNNNPNRIRDKIDEILEKGAWDEMCIAAYDFMYNKDANGGMNRLKQYLNRLEVNRDSVK